MLHCGTIDGTRESCVRFPERSDAGRIVTYWMISPALLNGAILLLALALFISERVRHDLVAILALLACLLTGLVEPRDALHGFADPAVVAVAAVLVVGRALELTGVAGAATARLMPTGAGFGLHLTILMAAGAVLSAFMNNIAALVITMPIATELARKHGRSAGAVLMPLSFATILGGMTTLIGTPANLIISSVREKQLGTPFGFFAMTPVGALVTALGLVYLGVLGWRLLRVRDGGEAAGSQALMTYELTISEAVDIPRANLDQTLAALDSELAGVVRRRERIDWPEDHLRAGDRLLVQSHRPPWEVADALDFVEHSTSRREDVPLARVAVAYGSPLIGRRLRSVSFQSEGAVVAVAAGARAADLRAPLSHIDIEVGDELFLEGSSEDIARLSSEMRLLEIDRFDRLKVSPGKAWATGGIFALAVGLVVSGLVPPALSFLIAAALIGGLQLIPTKEIYGSIDWTIIVLLAAMIPVGESFETSGAAQIVAQWLATTLAEQPLAVAIGAMCLVTMVLSVFLNNVATALIMAPLGIRVAEVLDVPPDALLLAVLVGASSDFLTPIGHQNNLLVMGPGGYRFSDYARVGAILAAIVVATTAWFLARVYG